MSIAVIAILIHSQTELIPGMRGLWFAPTWNVFDLLHLCVLDFLDDLAKSWFDSWIFLAGILRNSGSILAENRERQKLGGHSRMLNVIHKILLTVEIKVANRLCAFLQKFQDTKDTFLFNITQFSSSFHPPSILFKTFRSSDYSLIHFLYDVNAIWRKYWNTVCIWMTITRLAPLNASKIEQN